MKSQGIVKVSSVSNMMLKPEKKIAQKKRNPKSNFLGTLLEFFLIISFGQKNFKGLRRLSFLTRYAGAMGLKLNQFF